MGKDNTYQGLTHNIIAQGTEIVGTIRTEQDIRIDGKIEGDVICKGKVVIGQQGNVKGTITCDTTEIMGCVNGKLTIHDMTSLKSTANITGDLRTKTLSIEPGALFTGTCDMSKNGNATNDKTAK